MRGFRRVDDAVQMRLREFEVTLLASLVEQYLGLLEASQPSVPPTDSFARWQAEMDDADLPDRTDPVIGRLFPDAYPEDPVASAEFRRLTHARQRDQRRGQAEVVLAGLVESEAGRRPVRVPIAQIGDWLMTLAALRLSLAARLGIATEDDAHDIRELDSDDPRSYAYRVYEWLAYLAENLLGLR